MIKKQKRSLSLPIIRRCIRDMLLVCLYIRVCLYILYMYVYYICILEFGNKQIRNQKIWKSVPDVSEICLYIYIYISCDDQTKKALVVSAYYPPLYSRYIGGVCMLCVCVCIYIIDVCMYMHTCPLSAAVLETCCCWCVCVCIYIHVCVYMLYAYVWYIVYVYV
jgi:hypothetical protein